LDNFTYHFNEIDAETFERVLKDFAEVIPTKMLAGALTDPDTIIVVSDPKELFDRLTSPISLV
jgi:hypothetical protein